MAQTVVVGAIWGPVVLGERVPVPTRWLEGIKGLATAAAASAAAAEAGAALQGLDLTPLRERLVAVHGDDANIAVATAPSPVLRIDLGFARDEGPDR